MCAISLATGLVTCVSEVIDLFKSGKSKEAEIKLFELQTQASLLQGQIEINKNEANSEKVFVSGARPFILWVCGFALLNNYIIRPYVMAFFPEINIPSVDNVLFELLLGMLGLSGMRSFDKLKMGK